MTDIGYLQTKIRETKEKIEEIESNYSSITSEFGTFKNKIEESEKRIKESLGSLNSMLSKVDASNLKKQIDELVRVSSEKRSEKIIMEIESKFKNRESELIKTFEEKLQNVKEEIGKESINYINGLMDYFCDILFWELSQAIGKEKLSKVAPSFFPIKGEHGSEDRIFIFDFTKDKLICDKGIGIVNNFAKKYGLKGGPGDRVGMQRLNELRD